MAEILLSLTIIGVVAAITLPSLTGNINERTWNTQRKALYSRMSQAISLMPAVNGYGVLNDTADTATETFLAAGLSKVLKINNICDSEHFLDCGFVDKFTNLNHSKIDTPKSLYELNGVFSRMVYCDKSYSVRNTKAAAFETANGESIIAYYNRSCVTDYMLQPEKTQYGNGFGFSTSIMCANFIYDLNGKKGPNTFGKDIGFISVLNASDPVVVAPMPESSHVSNFSTNRFAWNDASRACTSKDSGLRIPNIYELTSIQMNKAITGISGDEFIWSGTPIDSSEAWAIFSGYRITYGKHATLFVRCIKRF